MQIYPNPPIAKVRDLLAACSLPASDLNDSGLDHFFGCGEEGEPKGTVGVELHGDVGLLRSLAVVKSVRGRGCGTRLVEEAEKHAARHGVRMLYLLTTTAETFFRALGYARVDRGAVPDTIRQTSEFRSLCPASSAVMVKRLG